MCAFKINSRLGKILCFPFSFLLTHLFSSYLISQFERFCFNSNSLILVFFLKGGVRCKPPNSFLYLCTLLPFCLSVITYFIYFILTTNNCNSTFPRQHILLIPYLHVDKMNPFQQCETAALFSNNILDYQRENF